MPHITVFAHHALVLASVLAALAAAPLHAATLSGVVKRVTDGDSFSLDQPGQPPLQVRISNIDAPEICQPWGVEAKAGLEALVLNQTVTVKTAARDKFGRTLATVRVGELDVGERLVRDGNAWSTRGRSDRGPLVAQERMAKALRRGFHGLGGAVMPSVFRKTNGVCPQPAAPGTGR
jgi:micrococcal nuclease